MTTLSSVGSAFLAFGAILTTVDPIAGASVAGAAAGWEAYLFIRAGR